MINKVDQQINKKNATCHSEASRYGCAELHLHGAVDEGAVGDAAVAALAAPPPSTAALSLRSVVSASQSVSAPQETSDSLWSAVGPPGGLLLHKSQLEYNCTRAQGPHCQYVYVDSYSPSVLVFYL